MYAICMYVHQFLFRSLLTSKRLVPFIRLSIEGNVQRSIRLIFPRPEARDEDISFPFSPNVVVFGRTSKKKLRKLSTTGSKRTIVLRTQAAFWLHNFTKENYSSVETAIFLLTIIVGKNFTSSHVTHKV